MKSIALLLFVPTVCFAWFPAPAMPNYTIQVPDYNQQMLNNLQIVNGVQQLRQQAQAAQDARDLAQQNAQLMELEQQNREGERETAIMIAEKAPGMSAATLMGFMTKFPERVAALKPYYEAALAREGASREAESACALGEAALEDNDFEGARKAAARALSLREGWRELRLGGMVLLHQKKNAQARVFLERAFRANGADILTGGDLAIACLACGMREKASEIAAAVLKIPPANDEQKAFAQRVVDMVEKCNQTKATPEMVRRARAYIARPNADPKRVELIKARFKALGVEI